MKVSEQLMQWKCQEQTNPVPGGSTDPRMHDHDPLLTLMATDWHSLGFRCF